MTFAKSDPKASTKPPAPPVTLEQVSDQLKKLELETRRTHGLLQQHMKEEQEERREHRQRYDGIMSLLQEVLTRLPSPTQT